MSGIISFLIRLILAFSVGNYLSRGKYRRVLDAANESSIEVYPGRLRIEKQADLSPEERQVEAQFAARLEIRPYYFLAAYHRKWSNVLNTDNARELSDDYNRSPETHAKYAKAVHEPAGALIKTIWRRMLKTRNPDGDNVVVFLAGGGGSGKTTAVEELPSVREIKELAQIVYDTTMADLDSSLKKVEEALAHEKEVIIFYVHRPYDLAARGMIRRAINSGRTVPADVLASDHYNAQRTFLELYDRYGRDPRIVFRLIDNRGSLDQIRLISVDFIEFLRNNLYSDVSVLWADVRWVLRDEFWRIVGNEYSTQEGRYRELHKCIYRAIFGEELS